MGIENQGTDEDSHIIDVPSSGKRKKMPKKKSQDAIADSAGDPGPSPNGKKLVTQESEAKDPDQLVIWRNPVRVIHYSSCELSLTLVVWATSLVQYTRALAVCLVMLLCLMTLHHTPSQYQEVIHSWEGYLAWCAWWVGLGILSSVGLGTGLHTFLLYLGPHIAAVTMAAYECNSLEFPQPPYPAQILCPEGGRANATNAEEASDAMTSAVTVTVWAILAKVRVEAFCWGAGTAIGELPPYFMARAARLSGSEPSEEEEEFHDLQEKLKNPEKMTRFEKMKYSVQHLVEKVGFFGILACASIPNPLFDLAGITCGHFLIPFWTFFGATLIGKAIIKMHIQKVFIILAFNNQLLETAISLLIQIPVLGARLEGPFKELLAKQKAKLHRKAGASEAVDTGVLGWI